MNAAIRDRALTLLSYRAHSRRELFDKLRRKGVPEGADLDEVLDWLEEQRLMETYKNCWQVKPA